MAVLVVLISSYCMGASMIFIASALQFAWCDNIVPKSFVVPNISCVKYVPRIRHQSTICNIEKIDGKHLGCAEHTQERTLNRGIGFGNLI